MADWTDMVASERIHADREFADRVDASSLSRQEWGLVMTAVEFEIENPEDPEAARVRADTSKVPSVLPAMDATGTVHSVGDSVGSVDGSVGPAGDGWGRAVRRFGRQIAVTLAGLVTALGLGGEDERMAEIESLTAQYCVLFQEKLEANGRWADVCRRARAPGGRGGD